MKGNVATFRRLVEEGLILEKESLRKKNIEGYTSLHEAVRYGHREVVEIMLMLDSGLALIENSNGETPLYVAAENGKDEVFKLLEDFGSDCFAKRNDGRTVLHAAIHGEHYRLATSILHHYPVLAEEHDIKGMNALNLLATKSWSFKSGSRYVFRDLSRSSFIPFRIIAAILYLAIPEMYVESEAIVNLEDQHEHDVRAGGITKRRRSLWLKAILGLPYLREIDREKQQHGLAFVLAKRLISKEDWSSYYVMDYSSSSSFLTNPLIQATRLGIVEIIKEILKAIPRASDSLDENGMNILHIAVERKNLHLYEYLKKKLGYNKDRMLAQVDKNGNTILHLASRLGSSPFHLSMEESHSTYMTRQMSWDVYWFKRTKQDCKPHIRDIQNSDGKTADEVFEENHLRLRKAAQKETLDIVNSTIVVATLLCTVNYAALFTLPGGFDQTSGLPVLDNKSNTLYLFQLAVYSAIFCSCVGLGALLSIQRSRFNTDDFYTALTVKAISASIGLFMSAVFTFTASALSVVLESKRVSPHSLYLLIPGYTAMALLFLDMSYDMFQYLFVLG